MPRSQIFQRKMNMVKFDKPPIEFVDTKTHPLSEKSEKLLESLFDLTTDSILTVSKEIASVDNLSKPMALTAAMSTTLNATIRITAFALGIESISEDLIKECIVLVVKRLEQEPEQ